VEAGAIDFSMAKNYTIQVNPLALNIDPLFKDFTHLVQAIDPNH
jgi:hypothetical protein